ncbi:MAG: hypothetical protein RRZ93_00210, partial [Ruthenibacterium sp.]
MASVSKEPWQHKIEGKPNGITAIIIFAVLSTFFVVLTVDQLQPQPNKSLMVAFTFGGIAAISLTILINLVVRYFCFKVYIGKTEFFFQSNPFNRQHHK